MFGKKKISSSVLSKEARKEIEKAERRILTALDKYAQVILDELESVKKAVIKDGRGEQPPLPLNTTGIPFYTYDDCEPVLSRHLKKGEEPRVIRFGIVEQNGSEEESMNNGNDNSSDSNDYGNAGNDKGGNA